MTVTADYVYEVNDQDDSMVFTCLIRAQEGIATTARAGVPPTTAPDLPFHVTMSKNEQEFGIHPRYVELARTIEGDGGNSCLVQKGTIRKKLPILTLGRFSQITVWESDDATNAPATARISLPTRPDGTGIIDYIVTKKIAQRMV